MKHPVLTVIGLLMLLSLVLNLIAKYGWTLVLILGLALGAVAVMGILAPGKRG